MSRLTVNQRANLRALKNPVNFMSLNVNLINGFRSAVNVHHSLAFEVNIFMKDKVNESTQTTVSGQGC
jgi:hypothetical protein